MHFHLGAACLLFKRFTIFVVSGMHSAEEDVCTSQLTAALLTLE